MKSRNNSVTEYQDKMFSELYSLNTLVNMTKNYCQDLEFKGQYYGGDSDFAKKLSDERNEYLTMLNLIAGKLNTVINLNLNIENEFL